MDQSITNKFTCSICGLDKPLVDYHKNSVNNKFWPNECKKCKIDKREQHKIDFHNRIKRESERRAYEERCKKERELIKTPEGKKKLIKNRRDRLRRKIDPVHKLSMLLNQQIYRLTHGIYKTNQDNKCLERTKATVQELMSHLESTLKPGQTMNDFLDGKLHLDHKIPKSWFCRLYGKDNIEMIKEANYISNLHLIPKEENLRKHNTYGHGPNNEIILYEDWVKTRQVPTISH